MVTVDLMRVELQRKGCMLATKFKTPGINTVSAAREPRPLSEPKGPADRAEIDSRLSRQWHFVVTHSVIDLVAR
jgi:hypothetical protein